MRQGNLDDFCPNIAQPGHALLPERLNLSWHALDVIFLGNTNAQPFTPRLRAAS